MCGGHSIQKSIFKLIHKLRFLLIFVLYRIFDMSFVHHNIIMVIRLCLYGWGLRFLLLLIAHLSFKFRSFTLEHPYPKFAIWLSCVHPCSSQLFCFYELFLSQSSGKLARLINLLLSNFNFSDFLWCLTFWFNPPFFWKFITQGLNEGYCFLIKFSVNKLVERVV